MAQPNDNQTALKSDGWKLAGDHQMQDLREEVRALERRILLELDGGSGAAGASAPKRRRSKR
ncbi:MAG TPA: hypothetical protein VKE22_22950 [Haliangiales bacterium]|nr:hypothetical protein [Haliangiales bacterium]